MGIKILIGSFGFDFNIREIRIIRDKEIFCLKIFNIKAWRIKL